MFHILDTPFVFVMSAFGLFNHRVPFSKVFLVVFFNNKALLKILKTSYCKGGGGVAVFNST